MHNFRELKIWKDSILLAKSNFELTKVFPETEKFGLISQMNRCSASIPSNIAEGSGRRDSEKDFARFLNIALGSSFELETQMILANEFNYITTKTLDEQILKINTIQKMIVGLKKTLKT